MYSPAPFPQTCDNCLGLQMVIFTVVNTCSSLLDVSGEPLLVNDRKVELLASQLQPVDSSLGNCHLGVWKQPEVLPHPWSLSKVSGVLQKQFLHVKCNRGQVSICLMQIMPAFETLNLFFLRKQIWPLIASACSYFDFSLARLWLKENGLGWDKEILASREVTLLLPTTLSPTAQTFKFHPFLAALEGRKFGGVGETGSPLGFPSAPGEEF